MSRVAPRLFGMARSIPFWARENRFSSGTILGTEHWGTITIFSMTGSIPQETDLAQETYLALKHHYNSGASLHYSGRM